MKKYILLLLVSIIYTNSRAQSNYNEKVKNIDAIIHTLYNVISGEKGETRNWELFSYLFHKDAKLIPTGKKKDGNTIARFLTPQDYINTSGKWLVANGFHEKELGRRVEQFGNIAHVFSTYESFHSKKETTPFMRGINSIQLLYDGDRWWIVNVFWQSETKEFPIPKKYID